MVPVVIQFYFLKSKTCLAVKLSQKLLVLKYPLFRVLVTNVRVAGHPKCNESGDSANFITNDCRNVQEIHEANLLSVTNR